MKGFLHSGGAVRLVARMPGGERAWAVRSIFPAVEGDDAASTFPSVERAVQGARMARQTGSPAVVFELFDEAGFVVGRVAT